MLYVYTYRPGDLPTNRSCGEATGQPAVQSAGWVYTNLFVSAYIYLLSTALDQTITHCISSSEWEADTAAGIFLPYGEVCD